MILQKSKVPAAQMFNVLAACLKYCLFALTLLIFLIHHAVATLLIRNEKLRLRYFLKSITLTARVALWILNVKIEASGERGEVTQRLIVANHLSYLDVLILVSRYPSLFVTSIEVKETFLLGQICQLAGCFFVERRRERRSLETKSHELRLMRAKFTQGFNIFLFPEGTSSDGSTVLPFKGTFFQLAIDSETPVRPVCLKYTGDGREQVPWYGEMTFPDHLFRLCLLPSITAKVIELPDVVEKEKMRFARSTQEKILEAYELS